MKQAEWEIESQIQEALDVLPNFNIFEHVYKTVNNQPIGVHILVPRQQSSGKRPLLVKLHGGGFHEGASDLAWRPWTVELGLKHNAVIVTPDYRLMPESSFQEIVDDLRDFWTWVQSDLEKLPGLDVDASNVAIVGESAGGYLAAQSVLLNYSRHAAVVMLQYPFLAVQETLERFEALAAEKKPPVSLLDDYLAKMEPGKILTRAPFSTRMDIARTTWYNGRFIALSNDPSLDPMKSLETAERIPPVFLFHGIEDADVDVDFSMMWAAKLKRLHREVPMYAVFPPGPHVLDKYSKIDETWLKEPILFVEKYWPVR